MEENFEERIIETIQKSKSRLSEENRAKLNELELFKNKVPYQILNGWTDLVYELGKNIEELCKLANCELPLIQQIKEKFGTLRFYYNTLNSQYPKIIEKSIRALVSQAENRSSTICEQCGKFGETRVDGGLYKTVCEEHQGSSITVIEYEEMMRKHYEERRRAKEEVEQNPKPKKTYFGLEIQEGNLIKESDIKKLPFYEFWLESSKGSTYAIIDDEECIYLRDFESFSKLFIETGKHRFQKRD
ncbi:hypothetical protein [Aliarcobacter butzleri]|uniref:hypothetical protein n=1 Tax=Aliarcobacter butzleri TaxID=28197 RepID=UPI002B2527F6|nr:hypothetical protein [Aliarcobacter butzleri]